MSNTAINYRQGMFPSRLLDIERGDNAMWYILMGLIGLLLVAAAMCRFTIVKEGTAKISVRFGGYRKTLLAKRGYRVDEYGNIMPGDQRTLPGGLRFVGIRFVDRIHTYSFAWIKSKSDGTMEDRREEGVNYILVRDYVYGLRVLKAEDKDLLPLDVLLSATLWISNPSKALFSVQDWYDAFAGRVAPYVRKFITQKSYDEVEKHNLEKEIFDALTADGIINELRNQYGINLRKIEVVDVNPGEDYRKLTLQKLQGRRDADQQVEQTAGRVLKSVAMASGLTPDELSAKLKADPGLRSKPASEGGYKEAFAEAVDMLRRDHAAENGDLADIRVANADGSSIADQTVGILLGGFAAATRQYGKGSKGGQGGQRGGQHGYNRRGGRQNAADRADDADSD